MKEIRCGHCQRKLAVGRYIELQIKCPRCGVINHLKAESHTNLNALSVEPSKETTHARSTTIPRP
jgi:phage FluMu protein Com